jgi:WD40 repeat protein
LRFNHGFGLSSLAFTPDGKALVSFGGGSLRLWDAADGRELAHIPTGEASFDEPTVLLPGGKTVVSVTQGFAGDTVHFWDLSQGKEVRTLPLPVRRNELSIYRRNALSPDGRLCAVHTPTHVHVFDLDTGKERCKLPKGGQDVTAVVFAGTDRLVTADRDQAIEVWEAPTARSVRRFAAGSAVQTLAASADGRWLATLRHHTEAIDRLLDEDAVGLWDLGTGAKRHVLKSRPKHWCLNVQFSPDGKLLFTANVGTEDSELTAWDTASGRPARELDRAVGRVLAASPDGRRLAEGSLLGKFELWDLQTGKNLAAEDRRAARAAAVFLSPAGDRVHTIDYSSVHTWSGATGRHLRSFEVPPYRYTDPQSTFSPDGRLALAFAGNENDLRMLVWDVAAGKLLHTLRPPEKGFTVSSAFSPDATRLATWHAAEQAVVRVWDVGTGREVAAFKDTRAGWPGRLFFTPDGKTLFVVGRQVVGLEFPGGKELFSWRPERVKDDSGVKIAVGGRPVDEETLPAWRARTVSPDGTRLAAILSEGFTRAKMADRIALYDARTGRVLRRWNDSGLPGRGYESLAFSPDGRLLATSDGTAVRLWEEATGGEVSRFQGHRGEVRALRFSGDGRRLASAGEDSTVLLWDVTGSAGARVPEPCWADLGSDNAGRAWRAVWALAGSPGRAVPFLADRLRPVPVVKRERLEQLIASLDSDEFAARTQASREPEKLGELAGPALRRALAGRPSPEARRRMADLVRILDEAVLGPEALRALRAVAALEHAATPQARRLLGDLAGGAEGARLTAEAKAALARLGRPPVP